VLVQQAQTLLRGEAVQEVTGPVGEWRRGVTEEGLGLVWHVVLETVQ
jgi:hypothetical protein